VQGTITQESNDQETKIIPTLLKQRVEGRNERVTNKRSERKHAINNMRNERVRIKYGENKRAERAVYKCRGTTFRGQT
jgi:hypothetical protein